MRCFIPVDLDEWWIRDLLFESYEERAPGPKCDRYHKLEKVGSMAVSDGYGMEKQVIITMRKSLISAKPIRFNSRKTSLADIMHSSLASLISRHGSHCTLPGSCSD